MGSSTDVQSFIKFHRPPGENQMSKQITINAYIKLPLEGILLND
jgi:hypothetical protein